MKSAIKRNQFAKEVVKTSVTASSVVGLGYSMYHVKNFVAEISDNEILGIAAGIGTLILGAVIINGINKGVDKAFEVKSQSLVIEVSDNFELGFDEEGDDNEQIENL